MATPTILAAKEFKHNNPDACLFLETCNFKRFNEIHNDAAVFVRRVVDGCLPLKVYYYA